MLLLLACAAGCGSSSADTTGDGGPRRRPRSATGGTALAVNLRSAGDYVILAESDISTVPPAVITGNLGISPMAATFITGFSLIADSTNVFSTSAQVTGKVLRGRLRRPDAFQPDHGDRRHGVGVHRRRRAARPTSPSSAPEASAE